jgi:hypothetical protein
MEGPLSPADIPLLLQCLQGALNQSSDVQKQAEAYLAQLEARPGFCSCLAVCSPTNDAGYARMLMVAGLLQEIIGNKEHDHSARWLASVQFKNSISRNWKGRPDSRWVQIEDGRSFGCAVP